MGNSFFLRVLLAADRTVFGLGHRRDPILQIGVIIIITVVAAAAAAVVIIVAGAVVEAGFSLSSPLTCVLRAWRRYDLLWPDHLDIGLTLALVSALYK